LFPPPKPAFEKYGNFTIHTVDPEIMVNLKADIGEKYFYVLSNVIAKRKKSVRAIDVYNINKGQYAFTIGVPVLADGQTPIDFAVYNNGKDIVVVYDNFRIIEYSFEDEE